MKKLLLSLLMMVVVFTTGCSPKEELPPLMDSDVVNEISLDAVDRWGDKFDVDVREVNNNLVIEIIADIHLDTETPSFKIDFMYGYNQNVRQTQIKAKNYLKKQQEKLITEGYNVDIIMVSTDRDGNILQLVDTKGNSMVVDGGEFIKIDEYFKEMTTM